MLRAFVAGAHEVLGRDLLGIYLLGSVVTREFELASSDIDFLVVTSRPISATWAPQLAMLHRKLIRASPWAKRLEGSYATRNRLRPWGIAGMITSVEGRSFRFNVRSDWTAENMIALREDAVALYGPAPSALFPRVNAPTLKRALRAYLNELVKSRPRRPEGASEVVLDIARCLYGLRVQRHAGKREAASWLSRQAPDLESILTAALRVRARRARPAERRRLLAGVSRVKKRAVLLASLGSRPTRVLARGGFVRDNHHRLTSKSIWGGDV